jgi:hypothetical protein
MHSFRDLHGYSPQCGATPSQPRSCRFSRQLAKNTGRVGVEVQRPLPDEQA